MTVEGKKRFELVFSYNLGGFYNEFMGNLVLDPRKITVDVLCDVLKFLSDNTDWVMGYEDIGDGEQSIYIMPIADLEK